MSEFIIPPCEITESDNPVIFLAGPVQGTDDWQRQAGEHIIDRSPRPVSVISRAVHKSYITHPHLGLIVASKRLGKSAT